MFESKTDPITLTHAHKLADVVCVIFAPALAFLHLVQRHRRIPLMRMAATRYAPL